jgi:1-phosphatidylinositol phosphodiesterase
MSRYPDSTPLTSLNIPGLHEAATWNYSLSTQATLEPIAALINVTLKDPRNYRCQRASIAAALDAGVRFFDLRYALDPTGTYLAFWHNEALLSERADLEAVLFGFWSWLDAHPSEVLLLSFQYEGSTKPGAGNDAAVQRLLFDVLTSPAASRYFLADLNALGTLGGARGRAVLVRRFDLDQLPAAYDDALPGLHLSPAAWTDDSADIVIVYNATTNATAYVEDYYEPDDVPVSANVSVNVAAKLNATVAHLQKAAGPVAPAGLFITFASGGHLQSDTPVFPETMAVGNGTDVTPLGGVNQQLVSTLRGLKGKRVGIVVLDFWDEPGELVDAILDL